VKTDPFGISYLYKMRFTLGFICCLFVGTSLAQCPPGEIQDCNGNCHPANWVGDGVCDNGIDVPSDFMCIEFGWDGGDCPCTDDCIEDCNGNLFPASWVGDGVCDDGYTVPSDFICEEFNWDEGDCGIESCGEGMVTDCNGNCVPVSLIGDGTCHSDGFVDFACAEFDWDGGDCPVECPQGEFADCNGNCFPNSYLQYLNDWHCHNELWVGGSGGAIELNLNCEEFDFDGGDCQVWACTDPEALNYYEHATDDDGSCFYGDCPPGTMDCMGNCIPENWIGTNECEDGPAEDPVPHLFNGAYPNVLSQNIALPSSHPRGLCILPDGTKAYVSSNQGISVVDLTAEGSCSGTQAIPLDGLIYSCCASVNGQYVFAANWTYGRVEVISTLTNTLITSIPTGSNTLKVRTSHNGQWIAASNHDGNTVSIIDPVNLSLITNIQVGNIPRNIAFSPNDDKLYAANWGSWTMSVINTATWEVNEEVPVDYWPQAVWALPGDEYVLVANFGFDWTYDHISVIRTSDWEVIARLQTGAGPEDMMSIGPNGEYLFVSNWGMQCCHSTTSDVCCSSEIDKGTVTIIATPDFDAIVPPDSIPNPIPYIQSTLQTVSLDAEYSFGMDVHPDGSAVYIANLMSHNLSVIGFDEVDDPDISDGDDCANPKILTNPSWCLEDCTTEYSDDYNEHCPFEIDGAPDMVYRYNSTYDLTVNIDLCASSFDTKIYIYQGSCGSYNGGEAIYCNDDFCGVNGWRSRLEDVTFEEGETYFIVIDGYGTSDFGHFSLCFENDCPGDFDGDAVITVSDLLFFLTGYGNQFDSADLLEFLAWFGTNCD
jgi:YVTN family beta-propeller protein